MSTISGELASHIGKFILIVMENGIEFRGVLLDKQTDVALLDEVSTGIHLRIKASAIIAFGEIEEPGDDEIEDRENEEQLALLLDAYEIPGSHEGPQFERLIKFLESRSKK